MVEFWEEMGVEVHTFGHDSGFQNASRLGPWITCSMHI